MEDQIANELTAEWTVASLKSLVGSASDVTTTEVVSVVIYFSPFCFQGKMLHEKNRTKKLLSRYAKIRKKKNQLPCFQSLITI